MLQVSAGAVGGGVEFGWSSDESAAGTHLLVYTSDRVCRLLRFHEVLVQLEVVGWSATVNILECV